MPGNTVDINSGWQEWYIADSEMVGLRQWLAKHGRLLRSKSDAELTKEAAVEKIMVEANRDYQRHNLEGKE